MKVTHTGHIGQRSMLWGDHDTRFRKVSTRAMPLIGQLVRLLASGWLITPFLEKYLGPIYFWLVHVVNINDR